MGNLAAASHGACIVVPAEAFDPLAVLEAVQAERCTSLYGVPTMFIAELDHPRFGDFDLRSLRTGIMAGSPCPVEVMKAVAVADAHAGGDHLLRDDRDLARSPRRARSTTRSTKRVGTVGRVHPHVEVKIVDPETGHVVPAPRDGRALHARLQRDARVLGERGGDAGGDRRGGLDAHGRPRDDGRRGVREHRRPDQGHDHPRRRERVPARGRGVPPRAPGASREAQVIGVPSAKYGEEVMAWVRPKPGATLTEEALVAHCTGRIATYKIPRFWKLVDELPMTVTGKVQKYRMREMAVAELGLGEAATVKTA